MPATETLRGFATVRSHGSHRGGVSCQARCSHHFYGRVVIRHSTWIETSSRDDHVDFRPVRLQTAWLDAIDADASGKLTVLVAQGDGVAVAQAHALRVFSGHDDVVALCTSDRILVRPENAV